MLGTLLAIFHFLLGIRPRNKSISRTSSTNVSMANDERTFIMIKPDAVQRGLVGDIIKRFEQKGFRLVAMKFQQVRELAQHVSPLLEGIPSLCLLKLSLVSLGVRGAPEEPLR
jgi:hypothetical protein